MICLLEWEMRDVLLVNAILKSEKDVYTREAVNPDFAVLILNVSTYLSEAIQKVDPTFPLGTLITHFLLWLGPELFC